MKLDQQEINNFQNEILTWYEKHQRDLPWRRDRDPYHILVSEIMLQQTQVNRVIPKYEAWLEAFPDVENLAKAKTSEVLRLWSGLGYNRRALFLQKAAQALVSSHRHPARATPRVRPSPEVSPCGRKSPCGNAGSTWIPGQARNDRNEWPRTVEELKKLPGIGEYTAAAIACFAFDEQIAVVDTNIRKVILKKILQNHPEFISGSPSKSNEMLKQAAEGEPRHRRVQHDKVSDKEIKEIAEQLLPMGRAYEWNQALMDYATAMLKQEKIPIPKQSRFKDSNRYYRGQTVKILLKYRGVSIKYLGEMLNKDETFMERIIQGLEKDGLVKRKNDKISLA